MSQWNINGHVVSKEEYDEYLSDPRSMKFDYGGRQVRPTTNGISDPSGEAVATAEITQMQHGVLPTEALQQINQLNGTHGL